MSHIHNSKTVTYLSVTASVFNTCAARRSGLTQEPKQAVPHTGLSIKKHTPLSDQVHLTHDFENWSALWAE